jgi:hypothetical protein
MIYTLFEDDKDDKSQDDNKSSDDQGTGRTDLDLNDLGDTRNDGSKSANRLK